MPSGFSSGRASPLPLSTGGAGGPRPGVTAPVASSEMTIWANGSDVHLLLEWLSPGKGLPNRESSTGDNGACQGIGEAEPLGHPMRLLRASVEEFLFFNALKP